MFKTLLTTSEWGFIPALARRAAWQSSKNFNWLSEAFRVFLVLSLTSVLNVVAHRTAGA